MSDNLFGLIYKRALQKWNLDPEIELQNRYPIPFIQIGAFEISMYIIIKTECCNPIASV